MVSDIPLPMIGLFTRNWWMVLLRGLAAICWGILALTLPALTLATLVLLFGVYAFVDGLLSLFAAIAGWQHQENRWLLVLEGLIGLGAGFLTLRAPGLTAIALIFFIGSWALATGVLRIVAAVRLRKEISGEFWLALSGVMSVAFGFLVMLRPAVGALAMIWVIGWYALFLGVVLTFLSFKLRRLHRVQAGVEDPRHRRAA